MYVHILHASIAPCQTVSICCQSFTQCHIPKLVILRPLRYTVKTHRHTSELIHTSNIHSEIWHSLQSRNKMSTEWYYCFFVCVFVFFVFLPLLLTCFPFFYYLLLSVFLQIPLLSTLVTFPNLLGLWYRGQTWKEVLRTRAYTLCQILLNNYEMLVPIHR